MVPWTSLAEIFDALALKSHGSLYLIDNTVVKAHRSASGVKGSNTMSGKIAVLTVCFLTALNVILVIVNVSTRSNASVAGMDYSDLRRDRDFQRAVGDVVEDCKVDGDRIRC